MRFRPLHYIQLLAPVSPCTQPLSRPYLARALQAVEGRLSRIYSRQQEDDYGRRLSAILAMSDADSPVWSEVMQVHYLETAREGLRSALLATRAGRGRPQ